MMDDELKRWCRISYTIMSAVWLGRKSPAEQAAIDKKRRADKRAVDAILAGMPDPAKVLSRESFELWAEDRVAETETPYQYPKVG